MRKIIHCDCDCFFAAVEMRDNPGLREIPLAIGGSAERRGVIATCNYPARAYGVRSAISTVKAMKLCPTLTVLAGNMEKYRQVSQQIFSIYRQFSSKVESVSLDEAYLDVTECTLYEGSATLIAEQIRKLVVAQTGITISAGVAPNKFLAKIASDWNKPDGLFVVPPSQVDGFVSRLPVNRINGVGEKTAAKLARLGIETCKDLQQFSLMQLSDGFGQFGKKLYQYSRGIDKRDVEVMRRRKSISIEHTYAVDLKLLDSCVEQLPVLFKQLQQRLNLLPNQYQIIGLIVKVKFFDFSQTTVERVSTLADVRLFRPLLEEAWFRESKPVRLLGLGFRIAHREVVGAHQLALF